MTTASEPADVTVDAREIDGKPCDDVHSALDSLESGDRFRLIVPFEPEPLYEKAENRGLTYESTEDDDGFWHVLFEHP